MPWSRRLAHDLPATTAKLTRKANITLEELLALSASTLRHTQGTSTRLRAAEEISPAQNLPPKTRRHVPKTQ